MIEDKARPVAGVRCSARLGVGSAARWEAICLGQAPVLPLRRHAGTPAEVYEVGDDQGSIIEIGVVVGEQEEEDHSDRVDSWGGEVARLGPEMLPGFETRRQEVVRSHLAGPIGVGDLEPPPGFVRQEFGARPAAAPHEPIESRAVCEAAGRFQPIDEIPELASVYGVALRRLTTQFSGPGHHRYPQQNSLWPGSAATTG